MKRHLKRFAWLYLTLLAVIAYPAFIIYMQWVPKYDIPTVRRVDQLIQEGFIRSHPDATIKRLTAADNFELPQPTDNKELIISSLAAEGTGATMPAVKPELDRVTELCAPLLQRIDEYNARNILFFPVGSSTSTAKASQTEQSAPNFLALQLLCKIRRVQAQAAINEQRWDDALRLLDSSANILTPYRDNNGVCSLIAIAARAIAYGGYGNLLRADPPPEVIQSALKSLVALRRTDPMINGWAWLGEKEKAIQDILQIRSLSDGMAKQRLSEGLQDSNYGSRRFLAIDRVDNLVQLRNQIHDLALRATAERFAQKSHEMIFDKPYLDVKETLKWTTLPVVREWLSEMARKEPWTYQNPLIAESEYTNLDHWTLMMIGISFSANTFGVEAQLRERITKTQGRLVEAGFAARLYKDEHGVWPKEFKELAEFYPLPTEEHSTSATSATKAVGTYLPFRFGICDMTPELRGNLWGRVLRGDWSSSLQIDGSFMFYPKKESLGEWFDEPVRMAAIEQYFRLHPLLVESVNVEVTTVSVPAKTARLRGDFGARLEQMMHETAAPIANPKRSTTQPAFRPLTLALARQITEDSYRLKAIKAAYESKAQGGATDETGLIDSTTITQPNLIRIDQIRLTGKLRAPEKAMVIWSPGPDGKDDNAQIVYDATNGTVSGGDIVLFPENY